MKNESDFKCLKVKSSYNENPSMYKFIFHFILEKLNLSI